MAACLVSACHSVSAHSFFMSIDLRIGLHCRCVCLHVIAQNAASAMQAQCSAVNKASAAKHVNAVACHRASVQEQWLCTGLPDSAAAYTLSTQALRLSVSEDAIDSAPGTGEQNNTAMKHTLTNKQEQYDLASYSCSCQTPRFHTVCDATCCAPAQPHSPCKACRDVTEQTLRGAVHRMSCS